MRELWIATGNQKKLLELERLLGPMGITLRPMSQARVVPEIDEDAPDFAGNAKKKAAALATAVGGVAVADDSGLCVDALDGRPGVHSARYAGPEATDQDRVAMLLEELADVPPDRRSARFVCSVALCGPDGVLRASVEADCPGWIISAPRGEGGFGYDPVFVPDDRSSGDPDSAPTFAQLEVQDKDTISHRGQALRRLASLLREAPDLLVP